MRYDDLKTTIEKVIKTNNSQEITALALQDTLKKMVDVTQSEQEGATDSLTKYVKEQDKQIRSALTATDTRLSELANEALGKAATASETAQTAYNKSVDAANKADTAVSQSGSANLKAAEALTKANEAIGDSDTAVSSANEAIDTARAALNKADEAVVNIDATTEVAKSAKESADTALLKATNVENNVDSALNAAKSAEDISQEALDKANVVEGAVSAAVTDAADAKRIAENTERNTIAYSEKGQPGGVATLDQNGDLAQFRMIDLEDSYLSDRTDTAPTARALHSLHEFHGEDNKRLSDEVGAILQLIQNVSGLGVSPLSIAVNGSAITEKITIVTNGNWTLTSDASWITPDKTSGIGKAVVSLAIGANSGSSNRTGRITVSSGVGVSTEVAVTQGAIVITTEYTLTVSPRALYFIGAGETKEVAIVSKKQSYKNGVADGNPVNVTYTSNVSGTGFSINDANITAAANQTTNTPSGMVTFTQAESGKTASVSLSQAAGVQSTEYSAWVTDTLAFDASSKAIPATGGSSVLNCKANQSRNRYTKWNGVTTATVKETQIINVIPEYSKVSGAGSINGTTVTFGNNTSTSGLNGVYRATASGKTADLTISQTAGAKQFSTWSVSVSASASTIGVTGGSVTITSSASRPWTWNGVAGSGSTESGVPTLSGSATGFTLSGSTVSATNNTATSQRSITVTATYSGVNKTVSISQNAGAKVYETPSVSLSYPTITPAATSGTPSLSYAQVWTWNGVSGSGGTLTSGASVSYSLAASQNGFTSVNSSTGVLTSTNMDKILGSRASANVTVTIALNGKSATKTATCTQGANTQTLVSITADASVKAIAVTGGSSTLSSLASYSYTSGATSSASVSATYSKVSGNGALSGTTVTFTNNMTTSVQSGVYRATYSGKTSDVTISQTAGAKQFGAWSVSISASVPTIIAGGGTSNISSSASRSYTWNGVAGSGGTESGTPTLSWANGSTGYSGFTLSGTVVTAENRGSISGANRTCAVRATYSGVTKDVNITQKQNVLCLSSYNGGLFKPSLTGSADGGVAYMDVITNGAAKWSSGVTVASGTVITDKVQFNFEENYTWAQLGYEGVGYKWHYDANTGSTTRSLIVQFKYYNASEVLTQSTSYTFTQDRALIDCYVRVSGPTIESNGTYSYKPICTVAAPTNLTITVNLNAGQAGTDTYYIYEGNKEGVKKAYSTPYTTPVYSINGNLGAFQSGNYKITW